MNCAYDRYDITTYGVSKLDAEVRVHWETNDDRDWGVPTEFAQDNFTFTGPDALDKALKHTGRSRQGIGHRVFVYLNGEQI